MWNAILEFVFSFDDDKDRENLRWIGFVPL